MAPGVPASEDNVAQLIDQLLKVKDPATVGLRRILKNKQEEAGAYQYRPLVFGELDAPGRSRAFSELEQRVIALEKQAVVDRGRLAELKARAEAAVKAAYEQGRKAGLAAGQQTGRAEAKAAADKRLNDLQERAGRVAQAVLDEKKRMLRDAEHAVVRLALLLARKIVQEELRLNPEVVAATVRKALTYIADRERMVIRVCPADYAVVAENRDFWLPVNERLKDVTVEQDERIERGGCIIESNSGTVDARFGVQFDELAQLVERVWEQTSGPQPAARDGAGT